MAEKKVLNTRILAHGIQKSYDDQMVLRGVDISVAQGQTLAIVGRSGCGKSTLLRCLSALEEPDDGDAFLDGQQYIESGETLFAPWEIRQNIVMVFQDYNLFPNMTGGRNITLALEKTKAISKAEAEQHARSIARKLGIEKALSRYPNTLSGGQAQRLALARAMVLQPKVLLLDEITSALDPETIINVVDAIRDLRSADTTGELTIILVTHLLRFASDFADRIAYMHDGVILEELPARDFFDSCARPETQSFVSAFRRPI